MNHFMIIVVDKNVYLRITDKDQIKHEYRLEIRQLALLAEQTVVALSTMLRSK